MAPATGLPSLEQPLQTTMMAPSISTLLGAVRIGPPHTSQAALKEIGETKSLRLKKLSKARNRLLSPRADGRRVLKLLDERRRFSLMLDYEFGKGTSSALPRSGLDYYYSRKSDRLKQVMHDGQIFAVIRPNGAIALSLRAAVLLASSRAFMENSVT